MMLDAYFILHWRSYANITLVGMALIGAIVLLAARRNQANGIATLFAACLAGFAANHAVISAMGLNVIRLQNIGAIQDTYYWYWLAEAATASALAFIILLLGLYSIFHKNDV